MEASYAVPHKAGHLVTPFIERIVFNKQQNRAERHKMQAGFYKRSILCCMVQLPTKQNFPDVMAHYHSPSLLLVTRAMQQSRCKYPYK